MKWCFIGVYKDYSTNKKWLSGFYNNHSNEDEYDEGLSPNYYNIGKYSLKEIKEYFDKPSFPFIYESFDGILVLVPSFIAFILLLKGIISESISFHKYMKDYKKQCERGTNYE